VLSDRFTLRASRRAEYRAGTVTVPMAGGPAAAGLPFAGADEPPEPNRVRRRVRARNARRA
jgi:hypothetical protein